MIVKHIELYKEPIHIVLKGHMIDMSMGHIISKSTEQKIITQIIMVLIRIIPMELMINRSKECMIIKHIK